MNPWDIVDGRRVGPTFASEVRQVAEDEYCPFEQCDPQQCPEAHD